MEFVECPCTGKTLTRLVRPVILAMLADESLHGYVIAQRIEKLAMFKDHPPDVSGIYKMLKTLESEELVMSKWDLSDDSAPKRHFSITPTGQSCLVQWIDTLESYEKSIREILLLSRQALQG